MQKLLLLFILSLSLFSQNNAMTKNPNVYSLLGDNIYNNIEGIESLKKLDQYKAFRDKIDSYSLQVQKAKVFGFEVESGARSNVKLDYLQEIRKLGKINDYFVRTAKSSFKSALDTKDSPLFIGIVNSGLIDTKKNKKKIMHYYNQHKNEIVTDGIIQKYIDEAYAKNHLKKKWRGKTKKQLEAEKIKRLRENDKLKQLALEKQLAEEVKSKKKKIRSDQEKELFN